MASRSALSPTCHPRTRRRFCEFGRWAKIANWLFQETRRAFELWIKDYKRACIADRLSDHRFWANQFRLFLHAAAYWLLDTLRRWLTERGLAALQLDTLRLRLLKVGGRVRELATKVRLSLASSHPSQPLWLLLGAAIRGHGATGP